MENAVIWIEIQNFLDWMWKSFCNTLIKVMPQDEERRGGMGGADSGDFAIDILDPIVQKVDSAIHQMNQWMLLILIH